MVTAVTFDLDNTLWDVAPTLLRAEQVQNDWLLEHRAEAAPLLRREALAGLRAEILASAPQLSHRVSALRRRVLFELQRRAGYSDEDAEIGTRMAFERFLEARRAVDIAPEALEVIPALARRFRLAAVTNGNADVFATALGPYFECSISADELGIGKPDPHPFDVAIARLGLERCEVVHVGDDPDHDIGGAHGAGLRALWFNPGARPWPGGAPPAAELRCLKELPAALASLERKRGG